MRFFENPEVILVTARPFILPQNYNLEKPYLLLVYNDDVNLAKKDRYEVTAQSQYQLIHEISCISQLLSALSFSIELIQNPSTQYMTIGYFFDQKKFDWIQTKKGLNSVFPIKYIPIDLRFPLNRKLNGFFHKIIQILKNKNDPITYLKYKNFKDMFEKYKESMVFFDSPMCLEVVTSRICFQNKFSLILSNPDFLNEINSDFKIRSIKPFSIKVPKVIIINPKHNSLDQVIEKVKEAEMNFPIVVKTISAAIPEISHFMGVALDYEGLKKIEEHSFFRYIHTI